MTKRAKRNQTARSQRSVNKPAQSTARQTEVKSQRGRLISGCDDNEGEKLWRSKRLPSEYLRIPDNLVFEKEGFSNLRTYESIALRHHVYVHLCHQSKQTQHDKSQHTKSFGIWGNAKNVQSAKKSILAWIEQSSPETNSIKKMESLASMTPAMRKQQERQWEQEVRRHAFRQTPPDDMTFAGVGVFHWPEEAGSPQEVLGSNLEALDPIRMAYSCYINLNHTGCLLEVSSQDNLSDVEKALSRLRLTYLQTLARNVEPCRQCIFTHDVKNDTVQYRGCEIVLNPYASLLLLKANSTSPITKLPRLRYPRNEDRSYLDNRSAMYSAVQQSQNHIMLILRQLYCYRGCITLRFRLGIFLTTRYRNPDQHVWSLENFDQMAKEPQFRGQVTQELGNLDIEKMLPKIIHLAHEDLTPSDIAVTDLASSKAEFDATFDFADSNKDTLRLRIAWQAIADIETSTMRYERSSEKWSRLDRGQTEATPLLDLSMIDLQIPLAWQVDLLAHNVVDRTRLPRELVAFAEQVSLRPCEPLANGKWALLNFKTNTQVHVLTKVTQRRVFNYHFRHCDYTLELAQFQTQSCHESGALSQAMVPRWSVALFRSQWDTMLSMNEKIGVGQEATWSEELCDWFPPGTSGKSSTQLSHESTAEQGCSGTTTLLNSMTLIEDLLGLHD